MPFFFLVFVFVFFLFLTLLAETQDAKAIKKQKLKGYDDELKKENFELSEFLISFFNQNRKLGNLGSFLNFEVLPK